jgi:tetratricopeptide (TPR) repeat protein
MSKTCPKCKANLSDDAAQCSECGVLAATSVEDESVNLQDIESFLTAANLHRIRGEWDEAIEASMAVLVREPENLSAHALLGDIYASQGRLEEAVRWYEMTVDAAPKNQAYADKLQKLRGDLADSYAHSDNSTSRLGWFDRFVIGESFESSIRIITVTSAAFGALLIAAALFVMLSHSQPDLSGKDISQRGVDDTRKPVVVESTPMPGDMSDRAAYEIQLWKRMNRNPLVDSRRIFVDDARVDPRDRQLIVTFRNRANSSDRNETLLSSGAVAAAGFTMNSEINYVTVRCVGNVLEGKKWHLDLVFVADVSRQSASVLQPNASSEQIDPVMGDKWWNPLVK